MSITYKKDHNSRYYYSEITLRIYDDSVDRIKNIDRLERKILKVLSEHKTKKED